MAEIPALVHLLQHGDYRSLAKAITIVENDLRDSEKLLESLTINNKIPIIGITGPPGAGKSTLVNALVGNLLNKNFRIGIVAVDPTSPFHSGSLLGDRIRLSEHFNHPHVFIRSLAARGAIGGLSEKILEVTDVMRSAPFDYIFIETVGVGQSEVEIAGLADTTIVVMVPEAGDEVQTMKAGLLEIADIFVVNKSDHVDANIFAKNLRALSALKKTEQWQVPVINTIAVQKQGIDELLDQIDKHRAAAIAKEQKRYLLADRAWRFIQKERMKDIDKNDLLERISESASHHDFNMYRFANNYLKSVKN